MTPFGIAGVQMHVTVGSNLEAMRHRIDLVMHLYPWVQMIVFSELCVHGPLLPHAQPLPGESEDELCTAARRHGIWLVNGSMFERRDGHIHNTTSVIDPQGTVIGRYRKLYPFQPFEQGVTPGEAFLYWDVPGVGRFGVLNCYDIWFPENARTLAAHGVEVILHPVLTHTIDRDVDLCIARATAAMQQCYVFDINGLGAGGNGYSAVFDPHGRALYEGGGSEQFIPVEIFDNIAPETIFLIAVRNNAFQRNFRHTSLDVFLIDTGHCLMTTETHFQIWFSLIQTYNDRL